MKTSPRYTLVTFISPPTSGTKLYTFSTAKKSYKKDLIYHIGLTFLEHILKLEYIIEILGF